MSVCKFNTVLVKNFHMLYVYKFTSGTSGAHKINVKFFMAQSYSHEALHALDIRPNPSKLIDIHSSTWGVRHPQ